MKRVLTPEQLARRRASVNKWHKENREILNLKRNHRRATDPEFAARCRLHVRNCEALKKMLKEAA